MIRLETDSDGYLPGQRLKVFCGLSLALLS